MNYHKDINIYSIAFHTQLVAQAGHIVYVLCKQNVLFHRESRQRVGLGNNVLTSET